MKTTTLLIVTLIGTLITALAGDVATTSKAKSGWSSFWSKPSSMGPAWAIGDSQIPANPIRRSETIRIRSDGSSYYHSQGTDTYITQTYCGPTSHVVYQTSYSYTSVSGPSPFCRYPVMYDDPRATKPAFVQGNLPGMINPIAPFKEKGYKR